MKVLSFSLRQARREWRSGELRALAAALAISAAALTAVGAFTQRVDKALTASANELLAADLVVQSRYVPKLDWGEEAGLRGLDTATTVSFPSVTFAGDNSLLVQVKAVSSAYPLRGKMEISDVAFGEARAATDIPASGEVWVDPRLGTELDVVVGDRIELGDLEFRIGQIIALEPDRASGVFNVAPRVMMNHADLPQSGLLGEGSRVRYRYLIAGPAEVVTAYREWLEPKLERGQYFQSLEDSQRQVSTAMDRAKRFLNLAALTAVILSGIAIVISIRQFVLRHLDTVAILRCLGARQRPVMTAFVLQLLWLALPALALGSLLGYAVQSALVASMGDLIPEALPAPNVVPAVVATATGLLALLGYGLPPLMALRRVPPIRVLNRQLGQPRPGQFVIYLVPIAFSVALVFWQAGDVRLGTAMSAGLGGTVVLLSIVAALLIRGLRKLSRGRGISWRFGLANVAKRGSGSLLQIAGLGLGLMVIFLLSVIQSDLLRGWRDSLPERTPNFFLINVQPDQVESTNAYLAENGIETQGLFPMAVSRLVEINGEVPDPESFADPRAERRLRGNVNLSWNQTLPRSNRIIEGQWWDEGAVGNELSLASSWATALELSIGDELTFDVGSQQVTATISSIREVDWDSFDVNFFIVLSPGAIGDVPRTYISSLYVPDQQLSSVSGLVRMHSNISVLDVGTILRRVRTIIERVSLTVQLVFGFTLLSGVVVLLAALQGGLGERIYEGAVLRTLGGSRRQLRMAVLAEFSLLGGVAGLLAAVAAVAVGWVMADQVFKMEYQPSLWLPPVGLVVGAVGIAITGLLGSRPVLSTPPALILRKG
jgi:putative ABC transport system permease protein